MKRLSLYFSVISLLFISLSCKKSVDVDPRDQYIGQYAITVKGIVNTNVPKSAQNFETGNDVLIVSKGVSERHLTFSFSNQRFSIVDLQDGMFFFSQSEKITDSDGSIYWVNFDGRGAFAGKNITFNLTVDAKDVKSILAFQGEKL